MFPLGYIFLIQNKKLKKSTSELNLSSRNITVNKNFSKTYTNYDEVLLKEEKQKIKKNKKLTCINCKKIFYQLELSKPTLFCNLDCKSSFYFNED